MAAAAPMADLIARIDYSEKYMDETYEYRHVILPKELAKSIKSKALLAEEEWRALGVQQSRGWEHYGYHRPEPHILLFRRVIGTDPTTGKVDPVVAAKALEAYKKEYGLA